MFVVKMFKKSLGHIGGFRQLPASVGGLGTHGLCLRNSSKCMVSVHGLFSQLNSSAADT